MLVCLSKLLPWGCVRGKPLGSEKEKCMKLQMRGCNTGLSIGGSASSSSLPNSRPMRWAKTSAQTSRFSHQYCNLTVFHGSMWNKTGSRSPDNCHETEVHALSRTKAFCFCVSQGTSVVMDMGSEGWQELVARSVTWQPVQGSDPCPGTPSNHSPSDRRSSCRTGHRCEGSGEGSRHEGRQAGAAAGSGWAGRVCRHCAPPSASCEGCRSSARCGWGGRRQGGRPCWTLCQVSALRGCTARFLFHTAADSLTATGCRRAWGQACFGWGN